jgi:ribonuclease HI
MAKKKYYAVAVGRSTGIFTRWFGEGGAEGLVRGYAGAVYKGFATIEEARAFIASNKGRKRKPPASANKKSTPRSKTAARPKKPGPIDPDRITSDQIKSGRIVMYTDGGALGNPGPGGYGAVIVENGKTRELSKGFRLTTNNRMELMACIAALGAVKKASAVALHSDSQYVVNGITKGWAKKWKANGWRKSDKSPALNSDLWDQLLELCDKHDVEFRWVKGHAGIAGNERCDELAVQSASGRDLAVDKVYENQTKSTRN